MHALQWNQNKYSAEDRVALSVRSKSVQNILKQQRFPIFCSGFSEKINIFQRICKKARENDSLLYRRVYQYEL